MVFLSSCYNTHTTGYKEIKAFYEVVASIMEQLMKFICMCLRRGL